MAGEREGTLPDAAEALDDGSPGSPLPRLRLEQVVQPIQRVRATEAQRDRRQVGEPVRRLNVTRRVEQLGRQDGDRAGDRRSDAVGGDGPGPCRLEGEVRHRAAR
ncbi:hypothetical protein [Streptomyces sp. NPDC001340]